MLSEKHTKSTGLQSVELSISARRLRQIIFFLAPFFLITATLSQAQENHRLDIATWNIQFFPAVPGSTFDHVENRKDIIARSIIASDVDVVAIQEAFDDEIQKYLSDALSAAYPYQVNFMDGSGALLEVDNLEQAQRYLDGEPSPLIGTNGVDTNQDSGLMLFSRLPFIPFSTVPARSAGENVVASFQGRPWDHADFIQFLHCEGTIASGAGADCLANKGVGLIRVLHPAGTVYNVAFTHLESGASQPLLAEAIRDLQINDIERMTRSFITLERQLVQQYTLILGDFNVNGSSDVGRLEWQQKFATEGQFLTDDFTDTWNSMFPAALEDRYRDPGVTNGFLNGTNVRLDYLFLSEGVRPILLGRPLELLQACVQQVRVAGDLGRSPAGEWLSDHKPVVLTLNNTAPHCGPSTALVLENRAFDNSTSSAFFSGETYSITHPEGAQWFLVTEPGTYSVAVEGVDGSNPRYDVFSSRNMSEPYSAYRDVETPFSAQVVPEQTDIIPRVGSTFAMPFGPFFVRVTTEDGAPGDYTLAIHKHKGGTPTDAIVLFPNEEVIYRFSPSDTVGLPTRFFRIDTDGPMADVPQDLSFSVQPIDGRQTISMLVNADRTARSELSNSGRITQSDTDNNFATFYLTVQAERPNEPSDWTVGWTTNLNIMVFNSALEGVSDSVISIVDETGPTDVGEDDNLRINFEATDGTLFFEDGECDSNFGIGCISDVDRRPNLGDFAVNIRGTRKTSKSLDRHMPCSVGFVQGIEITLTEEDLNPDDVLSGGIGGARMLAPDERMRRDQTLDLIGGGGHYQLKYTLSRGTRSSEYGSFKPAVGYPYLAGRCNRQE